jgi:voltage-gated potassium channel
VTTVGYGDVTPMSTSGQALSIGLMLVGTAFVAVITAAVTTVFIEQARALRERERSESDDLNRVALEEMRTMIERIEERLNPSSGVGP